MNQNRTTFITTALTLFSIVLWTTDSFAAITPEEVNSANVLDEALERFQNAAQSWQNYMIGVARFIFWSLAAISMVWTFGVLALKQSDIQEFFAEFVKFCLFLGLFKWLLESGPAFSRDLFDSAREIASGASGLSREMTPSSIIDVGFNIFIRILDGIGDMSFSEAFAGILVGIIVLIVSAIVSVNVLILLVFSWVLSYAGIILLGFGGSKWTSDMAISYYKTVFGVFIQLMVMTLIVGIGSQFLNEYYNAAKNGALTLKEIAVVMIVFVMLLFLVDKLPNFVAGIAGGPTSPQFGHAHAMNAIKATGSTAAATATGVVGGAATAGGALRTIQAASMAARAEAGAGSFISRAAQVAAGTTGNIAKGAWTAGKESMNARIDQTVGGRVANAIKQNHQARENSSGSGNEQSMNTISGSRPKP